MTTLKFTQRSLVLLVLLQITISLGNIPLFYEKTQEISTSLYNNIFKRFQYYFLNIAPLLVTVVVVLLILLYQIAKLGSIILYQCPLHHLLPFAITDYLGCLFLQAPGITAADALFTAKVDLAIIALLLYYVHQLRQQEPGDQEVTPCRHWIEPCRRTERDAAQNDEIIRSTLSSLLSIRRS